MTENEVDFFPLRVTGVTAAGKRKFDAVAALCAEHDLPGSDIRRS
jgi:hypothetical protein